MKSARQIASYPPQAEVIGGKYELREVIGRGGMGTVWEAWHRELHARVACKFIDRRLADDKPEVLSRFRSEARAAAALNSKHVVDVYDFGTMPDGTPYMVMEYLEGESLEQRLRKIGQLTPEATFSIVSQVAKALGRAHAQGIVHRDLKPDNIFLMWDEEDEQERVKVVDFGIAKFTQDEMGASHATKSGALIGTPSYMSPEQIRSKGIVDNQSDLWALGVVAFRCLTGSPPFAGGTVGDLLIEICTVDAPAPSTFDQSLPRELDDWMKRALAREKDARFSDIREFTAALGAALGVGGRSPLPSLSESHADRPSPWEHSESATLLDVGSPPPRPAQRKMWRAATIAAGIVAAAVGFLMARPDPDLSTVRSEESEPKAATQPPDQGPNVGLRPASVTLVPEESAPEELTHTNAEVDSEAETSADASSNPGAEAPATGRPSPETPSTEAPSAPARTPTARERTPQASTPYDNAAVAPTKANRPPPKPSSPYAHKVDIGLGY